MDSIPLIILALAVTLAIPVGVVLWTFPRVARKRMGLECPVRLRHARVLFRVTPNGKRLGVVRCSIFGRRAPSCGKVCIYTAGEA